MKKFLVKAITNDLINSYKGFNAALSAVDFTILSNVLNPKWCSAQVFLLDTPSR